MNDTQNPQTFVAWTQATPFRKNITILIFTFVALALIAKTVLLFKQAARVGQADNYPASITVTGKSETYVKPDTLQFTISLNEDGKDVGEATTKVTDKAKKAIAILTSHGVEEKNIKTVNWSTVDKYDSVSTPCEASAPTSAPLRSTKTVNQAYASYGYGTVLPCTNTTSKIVGATVYQTLEVKIRDIEKNATTEERGNMVSELAAAGIKTDSFVFTVFDLDTVKAQVRDEAIKKAKEEARVLGRSLGVSLQEITGFSEQGDGGYNPFMSARAEAPMMDKAGTAVPAPELPAGEQKVTSVVNITYLLK